MANVAKHKFTSAKADSADSSLVRPSNWNAEHAFAGGTDGQAVVALASESDGATWAWRTQALTINTTAVGNVGTGEDVLMTYTLPASTLGADGRALRVTVWGITAGNGNTKTIKFYFGSTSVTLNPVTAAPNAQVWRAQALIARTGATAQEMILTAQAGVVNEVASRTTPAETMSGAIVVKCTGEATSNDDISQKGLLVELLN